MLKRVKLKLSVRVAMLTLKSRTDAAVIGLLLSFLLMLCGDVEPNPGPTGKDNMRQTRLATVSARSVSADRADSGAVHTETQHSAEPTLSDVMSMLVNMNAKFDEVKDDVKKLKDSSSTLEAQMKELRQENLVIQRELQQLKAETDCLQKKLNEADRKIDDLESRTKRNNLLFFGFPKKANETTDDCEASVSSFLKHELEIPDTIEFDRVHRLNNRNDAPIIARFTFYKDRVKVMKAKYKLKGSKIFIGEDFSSRVREMRKLLIPHMKKARSEGKRVKMVFDHLYIDGKKFYADTDGALTEQR